VVVTFSPAVGVDQISTDPLKVSLFPNPAKSSCSLILSNLRDEEASVSVTDLSGNQMLSLVVKGPQKSVKRDIDLRGLSKGVYFVHVRFSGGVKVEKLILE